MKFVEKKTFADIISTEARNKEINNRVYTSANITQ